MAVAQKRAEPSIDDGAIRVVSHGVIVFKVIGERRDDFVEMHFSIFGVEPEMTVRVRPFGVGIRRNTCLILNTLHAHLRNGLQVVPSDPKARSNRTMSRCASANRRVRIALPILDSKERSTPCVVGF